MKKILKRGTKQTITCETCGCVFSFEEEDIGHFRVGEFVNEIVPGWKRFVLCPQCEAGVEVVETVMPKKLIESEE
jgi:hypothetical protein